MFQCLDKSVDAWPVLEPILVAIAAAAGQLGEEVANVAVEALMRLDRCPPRPRFLVVEESSSHDFEAVASPIALQKTD